VAGRGRAPKPAESRRNHHDPIRGEIAEAPGDGWQHAAVEPPEGLMPASVEAWTTWMGAWFASFWTPADLPGLRQLVRLYDQVERGEFTRASELRLQMDTYGITPKGQQDRRWRPPTEGKSVASVTPIAPRRLSIG
jgi:hypothetical protein